MEALHLVGAAQHVAALLCQLLQGAPAVVQLLHKASKHQRAKIKGLSVQSQRDGGTDSVSASDVPLEGVQRVRTESGCPPSPEVSSVGGGSRRVEGGRIILP